MKDAEFIIVNDFSHCFDTFFLYLLKGKEEKGVFSIEKLLPLLSL